MQIRTKKQIRCDDVLGILNAENRATFFTLTTPDEVDFETIRARWRDLRHDLVRDMRRKGSTPQYVMNYERHPGYLQKVVHKDTPDEFIVRSDGHSHGWHIHGVISEYLSLMRYRSLFDSCGFGRVDVRRVTSNGVSDYLTKHALKAYRGITKRERERSGVERLRLVNVSRGLPSLASYRVESAYIEKCRYYMALQVAEIKAAGFKVSNAISLWKRAEVAAMFDGITDPKALYLLECEKSYQNRNRFFQN